MCPLLLLCQLKTPLLTTHTLPTPLVQAAVNVPGRLGADARSGCCLPSATPSSLFCLPQHTSTPVSRAHAVISPPPHHSSMPPSYQPPRWAPSREHGLQLPLSRDQLGAMIMYPLLTTVHVCVCMETEEKDGEEEEEVDKGWVREDEKLLRFLWMVVLPNDAPSPSQLTPSLFSPPPTPSPSTSSPLSTSPTPFSPSSLASTPGSFSSRSSAGATSP